DDLVGLVTLRQSLDVGLEKVLVELAELLRVRLRFAVVEWWVGGSGLYERVVAAPARSRRRVTLSRAQERVLARTEVVTAEWLAVGLPGFIAERGGQVDLLAPCANAGDLAGFLVLEGVEVGAPGIGRTGVPELCRHLAPFLQSAHLDRALRESLDQVRRQA